MARGDGSRAWGEAFSTQRRTPAKKGSQLNNSACERAPDPHDGRDQTDIILFMSAPTPASQTRLGPQPREGRRNTPTAPYRLPPTWLKGPGDIVPRRALTELVRTEHMPTSARLAHLGLLAVTMVTMVFLLPSFLIYLAGLQSIMQVSGVTAGILGLMALMFSTVLAVGQTALVLKVPERLEWVRFGLTVLVLVASAEAVTRDWIYPSVMSMGFRWDLAITVAMILLLWAPAANRWFTASSAGLSRRATLGAHLAA